METDINRLKVVLAEKKRTNKWLCEQLNVNPSTVSKWCTNSSQPDLETLVKISGQRIFLVGKLSFKRIA